MRSISLTQAGAVALLALGAGLAVARTAPPVGTLAGTAAVLQSIAARQDHVTPQELAKWIVDGRKDYVLVDVRQPWEFDDYHIPGAVNVPLGQLAGPGGRQYLSSGKRVVLCSAGGAHAAQAAALLAQDGYDARALLDGLQGWWRDVMTPVSLVAPDAPTSAQEYRQAKALREHLLGINASGSSAGAPAALPSAPAAPTPAPAAPTPAPAAPAGGHGRGGGC